MVQLSVRLPLCRIGSEENDCDVCYWCDDVGQTVDIVQTVTKDIQYNNMMLSVMIYELYSPWDDVILSYGLFIVSDCDLVCDALCTWCGCVW